MIEMFRLNHVADPPAGRLSYGQQKLIDIAMAFMPHRAWCCWTNPVQGSTRAWSTSCANCWLELNKAQGGSFVVIEHNMDFIMRFART